MKFAVRTKGMQIRAKKTVGFDRGFHAKLVGWFELKGLKVIRIESVSVNKPVEVEKIAAGKSSASRERK